MGMFFYRRRMKKEYEQLLETLDRILAGELVKEHFDETMDAAIVDRVKRIMERVSVRQENAESERDKVKQMISDIGHQVRTPLSNITIYSGLLKETVQEEEQKRLAEIIERNAQTLSFHIQELLKTSYAEQEMIVVNPEVTNLAPIVKRACQRLESFSMERNISLDMQLSELEASVDVKWTEEALFNVLHNAVKYSEENSIVRIEIEEYDSFICVRIVDEGIGIPEEETGAVCGRFYRGSNVSQEQGIGIGLYLTREVLQRQQGYMKIDSKVKKGTTVSLYFTKQ